MTKLEYEKIGRILENTHPEIVKGAMDLMRPALKDTSAISKMYENFCQNNNPSGDFMDMITFISCMLNLYCPHVLISNSRKIRTKRGVCSTLTEIMGYNNTQSISYYIGQSRVYFKNNNFKDNVERVSTQLKEVA